MEWLFAILYKFVLYFIVFPCLALVLLGGLTKFISSFSLGKYFSFQSDNSSKDRSDSYSFSNSNNDASVHGNLLSFTSGSTPVRRDGSSLNAFSSNNHNQQNSNDATSFRDNPLIRKFGFITSGGNNNNGVGNNANGNSSGSNSAASGAMNDNLKSLKNRWNNNYRQSTGTSSSEKDSAYDSDEQEHNGFTSDGSSKPRLSAGFSSIDKKQKGLSSSTTKEGRKSELTGIDSKSQSNKSAGDDQRKHGNERLKNILSKADGSKSLGKYSSSNDEGIHHQDSSRAIISSIPASSLIPNSGNEISHGRSVLAGAKKNWADKNNFVQAESGDVASDGDSDDGKHKIYNREGRNRVRKGSKNRESSGSDRDDIEEDVSSTNDGSSHVPSRNKKHGKKEKRDNISLDTNNNDSAKGNDTDPDQHEHIKTEDQSESENEMLSSLLGHDAEGHKHKKGRKCMILYVVLFIMLIVAVIGGLFSYLTFKCAAIKSSSSALQKLDETCPTSLANITVVYSKSGSCKLFHKYKIMRSFGEQMIIAKCNANAMVSDMVSYLNDTINLLADDNEEEEESPTTARTKEKQDDKKVETNSFPIQVWNGKKLEHLKQQIVLPKSIVKILDHKPIVEEYILAAVILLSLLYQGVSYWMQSRSNKTHSDGNYSTANEASNDKSPTSIESRFSGLTGLSPLSEFCLHFTDTLTASGNEIWTLENSLKLPKVVRSDVIEKCGSMLILVSTRVKLDGEREDMLISDVQRAIKLRIPIALVVDGPLADGNISKRFNGKTKEMIEALERALVKPNSQIYIHSIDMSIGYPYMSEEARKSLANVFERSKKHRNKSYSWDVFVADCGMDPISNEPDNSLHSVKPIKNVTDDIVVISNSRRSSPHNMQKAKERKLPPALQLDSEGYANDSITLSTKNHQSISSAVPPSPMGTASIRSHASTISSVQDALTYLVAQIHDPGSVSITQKLILEQWKQGQIGQSEAEILMKLLSIKVGQPLNESQLPVNDTSLSKSDNLNSFESDNTNHHQPTQNAVDSPNMQSSINRESNLGENTSKVSSIHASAVSMSSSEDVMKDTNGKQDNMVKSFPSDSDIDAGQTTLPIPQFSRQVTLPSRVVAGNIPNPMMLMRSVSSPIEGDELSEDKSFPKTPLTTIPTVSETPTIAQTLSKTSTDSFTS